MPDYPKMYAILCAAASDAIDRMDEEDTPAAKGILQEALTRAEELYIAQDGE